MVNQAALKGSADGKEFVEMVDFEYAKDKIIMGEPTCIHCFNPYI